VAHLSPSVDRDRRPWFCPRKSDQHNNNDNADDADNNNNNNNNNKFYLAEQKQKKKQLRNDCIETTSVTLPESQLAINAGRLW